MILLAVAVPLALIGLYLLAKGVIRLAQLKLLRASACSCGGLAFIALGSILIALSINITGYQRLTLERKVADLHFYQVSPQHFTASVRIADGEDYQFELKGDEWQLDAKVLKWQGYANLLGLDAHYKLDRISGRYRDIEQAQQATGTTYALSAEPGLDIWQSARSLPWFQQLVDAYYGNATYLPMADNASYSVHISQSGLIARPTNEAAKARTDNWQ